MEILSSISFFSVDLLVRFYHICFLFFFLEIDFIFGVGKSSDGVNIRTNFVRLISEASAA